MHILINTLKKNKTKNICRIKSYDEWVVSIMANLLALGVYVGREDVARQQRTNRCIKSSERQECFRFGNLCLKNKCRYVVSERVCLMSVFAIIYIQMIIIMLKIRPRRWLDELLAIAWLLNFASLVCALLVSFILKEANGKCIFKLYAIIP